MKIFTKVNGKMIINMDTAYKSSIIHHSIKEVIKMECRKVMDCLYGQMDKDMKDFGTKD